MTDEAFTIFVSYARDDNRVSRNDPTGPKGFVTLLCEEIRLELADLHPRPQLWCDVENIDGADQFDPKIADAIQRSSLFVVVLSDNWLNSDYCRYELGLFRKRWWHEDDEAFKHRVILVRKAPVASEDLLELFPRQEGFEFYSRSGEPFYRRGEQSRPEFFQTAASLGRTLCKRASPSQLPRRDRLPPSLPADARKVYLAQPAMDMLDEYIRLAVELTERGYQVVPPVSGCIPLHSSPTKYIDDALADVDVSIHPIGFEQGLGSEPFVKLQLARAERRARELEASGNSGRKFSRFIWIPRFHGKSEVARHPVETLAQFGQQHKNDTILGEGFPDLKAALFTYLEATRIRHDSGEATSEGAHAAAGSRIYLCHDEPDTPYAIDVGAALRKIGVRFVRPSYFGTSDEKRRELHKQYLNECDAVLLCWAQAPEYWATSLVDELEDWSALGRRKSFDYRGLIAGPPPHFCKSDEGLHQSFPDIEYLINVTDPAASLVDAIRKAFKPESTASP